MHFKQSRSHFLIEIRNDIYGSHSRNLQKKKKKKKKEKKRNIIQQRI